MKSNKVYTVHYIMSAWSTEENYICVLASSKAEAYDKAVFEELPRTMGSCPYAAYVSSVTYSNGNYRRFNTFVGNPY